MIQKDLLEKYYGLYNVLSKLCADGMGDTEKADEIREELDPIWYGMNDETLEALNKGDKNG